MGRWRSEQWRVSEPPTLPPRARESDQPVQGPSLKGDPDHRHVFPEAGGHSCRDACGHRAVSQACPTIRSEAAALCSEGQGCSL